VDWVNLDFGQTLHFKPDFVADVIMRSIFLRFLPLFAEKKYWQIVVKNNVVIVQFKSKSSMILQFFG
jgi:hypothetical protein